MSYRLYLYKISNEDYEKINNLNKKELFNKYTVSNELEDGYISIQDLAGKQIFELGKFFNFDIYDGIKQLTTPFFTDEEVEEEFNDGNQNLKVVPKEVIKLIIKYYCKEVFNEFNFDENNLEEVEEAKSKAVLHYYHYKKIWDPANDYGPCNLDENSDNICDVYNWEYNVFELTRIYKTFDFNNNKLIFAGY